MAEPGAPGLGRLVAGYDFDRRKTWSFVVMLVVLIGLGLTWLWSHGLEAWGLAVVLVLLPGVALLMLLAELRLARPVLLIGERGLLDRRRGGEPVAWPAIQEATVRRRSFNRGIRIMLTNGERYDIELNLLAADPIEVMRHIQEQASAAQASSAMA